MRTYERRKCEKICMMFNWTSKSFLDDNGVSIDWGKESKTKFLRRFIADELHTSFIHFQDLFCTKILEKLG